MQVSPEGEVLQTLTDMDGRHIAFTSSVTEVDGRLWLGNVVQSYISYLDITPPPPPAPPAEAPYYRVHQGHGKQREKEVRQGDQGNKGSTN